MSAPGDKMGGSIARAWLHQLLRDGGSVAFESDRWFLTAVDGVQRGTQRTSERIGVVGEKLFTGAKRRLGLGRSRLERIRKMLETEVQRSGLELSEEQAEGFTENMSLLLELVLNGTIPVDDVAIQCEPDPEDDVLSQAPGADARPPEA